MGESQSNGTIERAIQAIEGQIRTSKDHLETLYKEEIDTRHPILPWLVQYASAMLTRCEIGVDGRTAYERLKGKRFHKDLPMFGECVHFKPLKDKGGKTTKLQVRWHDGVYLGIREG